MSASVRPPDVAAALCMLELAAADSDRAGACRAAIRVIRRLLQEEATPAQTSPPNPFAEMTWCGTARNRNGQLGRYRLVAHHPNETLSLVADGRLPGQFTVEKENLDALGGRCWVNVGRNIPRGVLSILLARLAIAEGKAVRS